MLDGDALDTARQIDRPGHRVRRGRIDLVDDGKLGLGEILVPAQLLQDAERELGITVLDLGVLRVIAVAEQADLALGAVGERFLALQAKAGAEGAAALLDRQVRVVEQRRARMLELGRAALRRA